MTSDATFLVTNTLKACLSITNFTSCFISCVQQLSNTTLSANVYLFLGIYTVNSYDRSGCRAGE